MGGVRKINTQNCEFQRFWTVEDGQCFHLTIPDTEACPGSGGLPDTGTPKEPSEGVALEIGGQNTSVLQWHLLHSVSETWGHELGAVSLQ